MPFMVWMRTTVPGTATWWVAFSWLFLVGILKAAPAQPLAFQFKDPEPVTYEVDYPSLTRLSVPAASWWRVRNPAQPGVVMEVGRRIILQLADGLKLDDVLRGRPLVWSRTLSPQLFILEAPTIGEALDQASALASQPGVLLSCPVRRLEKRPWGAYFPQPNDSYFDRQWNLENRRASDGSRLGADLNVRAAWPLSQGEGVLIAIADDGVELTHPDLAGPATGQPHFNFATGLANGRPQSSRDYHGTPVASLAAAEGGNRLGMAGVAPKASLASWVIWGRNEYLVSEEALMDMFQYASNVVWVQNHSWGNAGAEQILPSTLERIAISNALTLGRSGKGIVMVRAGGNMRDGGGNANDDGYLTDPAVVAAGATRSDGRTTSYSNPGACLLVSAPAGDDEEGEPSVFTADRLGSLGLNTGVFTNDLADYAYGSAGFSGTSAAAPQVSGVVALMLAANPALQIRDVQQALLLSARHVDAVDPDLITNGAGFRVSHNVGFGIPDAGQAVQLARAWSNRPPLLSFSYTNNTAQTLTDAGLRLRITGTDVPTNLMSIVAMGSTGLYPDVPSAVLPLADAGAALAPLAMNLRERAPLIQRGTNFFRDKITYAAAAGAPFAVIYNNRDGDALLTPPLMGGSDFVTIPAVFIGQKQGEALVNQVRQGSNLLAQIQIEAVTYSFTVTNQLAGEYALVRVKANHPRRGDLRMTLLSPPGTRSVLQRVNSDDSAGPSDWTYLSRISFGESTWGEWTVSISDQLAGKTGGILSVALTVAGVPISDEDHDGLDDDWERLHWGSLAFTGRDDPDGDGHVNGREHLLGTDPTAAEPGLAVDLSSWNASLARLSWPAQPSKAYQVYTGARPDQVSTLVTNLPAVLPETEWFMPLTADAQQYFRVQALEAAPIP
jgi:subtilisin family serine protease